MRSATSAQKRPTQLSNNYNWYIITIIGILFIPSEITQARSSGAPWVHQGALVPDVCPIFEVSRLVHRTPLSFESRLEAEEPRGRLVYGDRARSDRIVIVLLLLPYSGLACSKPRIRAYQPGCCFEVFSNPKDRHSSCCCLPVASVRNCPEHGTRAGIRLRPRPRKLPEG